MHYVFAIFLVLSFNSYLQASVAPTQRVYETIEFSDDLNLDNMLKAIDRQMVRFNSISQSSLNKKFKLGTLTYKRNDLKNTMIEFRKLVVKTILCQSKNIKSECFKELSNTLNSDYRIYKPLPKKSESGYSSKQTLFTAYYSPDFMGSKVKTEVYKHAIYALPKTEQLRKLTRKQIDFEGKLEGKGLELFYVSESLYDIWLLHVEGGGRVKVRNEDGSISSYYLSYANSNSQPFNMLYKYMRAEGMIVDGRSSIAHQRAYLDKHPEDVNRVLSSCPSYIFFKVTLDEPLGVQNMPLTENRSLATDYRIYKEYGLLNFIQAKKPTNLDGNDSVVLKKFSRFMINQDTGGAIRGNARSDLYFGFGKAAELAANHLKNLGNQYFLIKKQ
jgi:membrane-bound lytic murein transglycosylase A